MFEKDVHLSDLLEVLDMTRAGLESTSIEELQKEVLRCCEKVFQSSCSAYLLVENPPPQFDLERSATRGASKETLRLYQQYYQRHDPSVRPSILFSDVAVLTLEEVVPFNKFLRSEIYNDFLKPRSIYHQLYLRLRRGNRLLGVVTMCRPKVSPPFSSIEKNKAVLLIPYLVGTLEKAIASDNAYVYQSIVNTVASDLLYGGLIVLDSLLKPLYYNEAAEHIMQNLQEVGMGKGEVPPLPDEIYRRCKALISSPPRVEWDQPFHEEVRLPVRKFGQEVSIRLRLTKAGDKDPLFLVYLEPPENVSNRLNYLNRHGLTRREYEVALLVAKGLSDAQVAEKLFISEYTVDNHLRSIYRKMGVNKRTSLAYRLLQSH